MDSLRRPRMHPCLGDDPVMAHGGSIYIIIGSVSQPLSGFIVGIVRYKVTPLVGL